MKNKYLQLIRVAFVFFVMLLSVAGVKTSNAQSTVGNDFWVTFLPNDPYDNDAVYMSLIAAGSTPCTGTVTNPFTNWSTSFVVSVGATTIIDIPLSECYSLYDSDCVLNTGLHVVSTENISLYASNFMEYSFDVTDVLPTSSLGSNYLIQTYTGDENRGTMVSRSPYSKGLSHQYAEISVVAVENNTTVYITLTCDSQNGHYANQPFSVTLNAGQCYQVQSVADGDFSGSQVLVSGNKRVAVFAGNSCTNVPSNCAACDHIVEQMMPTSCLGNHFVITNSSMRTNDVVRVTAANNGCQIFVNGSFVTTINQKETYQFEITSENPSIYLETSEPAMVYLYFSGASCGGENGDPSMVMISPIEQKMDYVTFSTFNSGASQYHFVNVVTNTEDVTTVQLDGNSIASEFQTVSGNLEYSFARVAIEHGSHTLSTTGEGFVAHVYGLGSYESYAYSVGSNAVQELYTSILVNGQTASGDMNVCDETVNFDLNYNYDLSQVNWTFGDGQTGSGIPITHEYANLGDYPVSCDVYKLDSYGQDSLVATLNTVVHIHESYYTEFEATALNYYYWEWMGEAYYESGDYSYNGQTIYGCDSIVTLHLTITHEISAIANPTEGGSLTGGGIYNQGQTCTLSATANTGYEFLCWTDETGMVVSLEPQYSFTVTQDRILTAIFIEEGYCGVRFDFYDSYGDGWNGNYLVVNYADGTYQQLTLSDGSYATYILPIADGSHNTLTWIEGSWMNECSFTVSYMNGNEIYYGSNMNSSFAFEFDMDCVEMPITPTLYITATANPYEGGVVSGEGSYRLGENCILTAMANDGYTFVNWTKGGMVVSTDANISFIITETATYVANFQCLISTIANPIEGGMVTGEGYYDYGSICTLVAAENPGYSFVNWTRDDVEVSTNATYSFTVTENATYVANFTLPHGLITQVTNFGQGYNWWSTYVEQDIIDGMGILQEGMGDNGVTILSQANGYTDNYVGYGWYGSLTSINNESSYRVITSAPCTVTMTSSIAMPSQHPITISEGWTWIGYVPSTAMDVNSAMAGVEATIGDKVKSQQSYADYYPNYGWFGSLNTIEPGMGLMYYSMNDNSFTFTYPNNDRGGELKKNLTAENNHWEPNPHAYPTNMTLLAVIDLDGEEIQSENYELAVFDADGECRGSIKTMYVDITGRYYAFMTIYGDSPVELHFGLYDWEAHTEIFDVDETVMFNADASIGTIFEPMVLHFHGLNNVDEFDRQIKVFPNPVNCGERFSLGMVEDVTNPVRVEIINTMGVVETVCISSHQTLIAPNVAGVYTLRITVEGKGTVVRKLVVK